MRRLSIISAIAFTFAVTAALAQGQGQGLINAIAYKPLPGNLAFSVQPLDNSDRNMKLKDEFERILTARGFSIDAAAPLVITFEVGDEPGAYETRNKRAFIELNARGGRDGGEDARMRLNLYDSNSGGVFNRGKGETSVLTSTRYRLDVSIDNRTNGKRHWQAWAVAKLERSDGTALFMAMVPEMIENMGKTVKSRTFELF